MSTTDDITQERLAGVLETRGTDSQQRAMRRAFLSDIAFPAQARVLDVGCGTGVLTRVLARWPDVEEVVGSTQPRHSWKKAVNWPQTCRTSPFRRPMAGTFRFNLSRGGSHNLVVGSEHGYTSFGGLVAGHNNQITGHFASVTGGINNTAS